MSKKIILVSHGKLSAGMLHSVQMIVGENETLSCYGMMPGEHYQTIVDQIAMQAKENPNIQYIIIADLLGGSVCNGCMEITNLENIKLISGMNMGLVIELLFTPAPITDELIAEKISACKDGIRLVEIPSNDNEEYDFF